MINLKAVLEKSILNCCISA